MNTYIRPQNLVLLSLGLLFLFCNLKTAMAADNVGEDLYIQLKTRTVTEKDLDLIKEAGFAGIRIGMAWRVVEKQKGVYRYDQSIRTKTAPPWNKYSSQPLTHEKLVREMAKRDLKMMVLFSSGNPLYTGPWHDVFIPGMMQARRLLDAPATPEAIDAFSKFVANTVDKFSTLYTHDMFTWLIWNEPTLRLFHPPKPNPETFSDLFMKTCQAVKKVQPDAIIAGPGFPQYRHYKHPNFEFIETMLNKNNLFDCIDYMTFHPYRPGDPETVYQDYSKIRTVLRAYTNGQPPPIGVDEVGYSNYGPSKSRDAVSQANRAVRMYFLNQMHGIKFTNIYEWRDSGTKPNEREHNFGLLTKDGKEKPLYYRFKEVLSALKGYHYKKRAHPTNCSDDDYVLIYGDGNNEKIVTWSISKQNTKLVAPSVNAKYSLSGEVSIAKPPNGIYDDVFECIKG